MLSTIMTLARWLKTRKGILLLFLVLALGSFLRIYQLGTENLWNDEGHTLAMVSRSFTSAITEGWQPPYYAILHPWVSLFGNSEIALRAPSVIFGILSILVIYLIGCALFNRKVGLISSLLAAISSFYIAYSQEARSYALILLLALLSYLFFILILKQDKKWYYPCYLLANILLVYTNPVSLSIIAAQIFYLLLFWTKYSPQRFKLIGTQGATILASLPVVPWVLGGFILGHGTPALDPSLATIYETLRSFAGREGPLVIISLFLAAIAPLSLRKMEGKWALRKPLESLEGITWNIRLEAVSEIILLLLWLLLPIASLFIASKIIKRMYLTRWLIAASPALYLLVAKGLSNLKVKWVLYPLLLAIVLLAALPLGNYYTKFQKPQWREAAELVELNTQENDVLLFCQRWRHCTFNYYYHGKLDEFEFSSNPQPGDTEKMAAVVDEAIIGKERLWLILCYVPSHPPIETYLIDRYGDDSIIMERHFTTVRVFLFDLAEVEGEGAQ
jgi:mannosyltransferase